MLNAAFVLGGTTTRSKMIRLETLARAERRAWERVKTQHQALVEEEGSLLAIETAIEEADSPSPFLYNFHARAKMVLAKTKKALDESVRNAESLESELAKLLGSRP